MIGTWRRLICPELCDRGDNWTFWIGVHARSTGVEIRLRGNQGDVSNDIPSRFVHGRSWI